MIFEKLWPLFTSHTSLASGHRVYQEIKSGPSGADLGGGCGECTPRGFLIQLVFCKKIKSLWFIGVEVKHETSLLWLICWCVFSAVHIMLLPSQKPSLYLLLKFVYITSGLRHSLVVHPLLRKILDPPLHL